VLHLVKNAIRAPINANEEGEMPMITESSKLPFDEKPTQREGRIQRKALAKGVAGAPDNFEFNIYRFFPGYMTPRHRHNWEQMRFGLDSELTYEPSKVISTGSLVYFPEGAYYGPQESPVISDILLLQYGGASGQGYLSQEQLFAAREELMKVGQFKGGIYTHFTEDGKKHNKDGAEAIWEHVFKKRIRYVKPRIPESVKFEIEAFEWIASTEEGLEEKLLAVLTERKVKAAVFRSTHRTRLKVSADERQLFFTLKGEFSTLGKTYGPLTSVFCDRGESLEFSLEAGWESLAITLPQLPS